MTILFLSGILLCAGGSMIQFMPRPMATHRSGFFFYAGSPAEIVAFFALGLSIDNLVQDQGIFYGLLCFLGVISVCYYLFRYFFCEDTRASHRSRVLISAVTIAAGVFLWLQPYL